MTISSTTVKNSYSGNGTLDTFNYTFKVFADADLQVIIRDASAIETVKTLTTHYTVTGAGNANGGTVVFTAGNIPTATETVVIRRASPQTQSIDYIANDPFPAESHEEGLDRSMMAIQQLQEEIDRSIKLSRTNTMTSTEFTVGDTDRANKVFGFDASGELTVAQELGTFKGNWSSGTTFAVRDIIKDTSNNNVYICLTAHTSSGSQPISTNTDVAKWGLLVDAASATTSATNAANSASAAATSATNAATSESNASTSATNSASSASTASTQASNASTSASNAATSATAAASSASAAEATFDLFDDSYLGAKASNPTVDNDGDALQDGALYFDTTNDVMKVYNLANTTWYQLTPTVSNQTNINTVAGIASDITTVSNINLAVTNVSSISPAVSGVNSNSSNINTVSGISGDVTAVANISSDVQAVENIKANVTTVAGISGDVTSVANISTAVSNVNSNSSNINAVNANSSNINAVNANSANINAVAGDATDIGTVATDLSGSNNIGTVAGAITNVNNVGGSIANVNTVATNITGVNSFAERYRVVSSNPTSSLDAGDLAFVTNDSALKFYNGSSWTSIAPGIANVVDDTTPQLGGNLDLNSNDITGTGNINITGTGTFSGDLTVDTNTLFVDASANTVGIGTTAPTPPSAYNGLVINATYPVLKLTSATSGTGVSDGFTIRVNSADDAQLWHYENKNMSFATNNAERMRIRSNGKIGLGTTSADAELHIEPVSGSTNASILLSNNGRTQYFRIQNNETDDALVFNANDTNERMRISSAGLVGIGTSSPGYPLEINSSAQTTLLHLVSTAGTSSAITFANTGSNDSITIGAENDDLKLRTDDGVIKFFTNENSEKIRIDSSGNVGIKNTVMSNFSNLPATDLVVGAGTTHSGITIYSSTSSGSNIGFADGATGDARNQGIIQYHHNGDYMRFFTSATERMRIDSSGNVGIGVTPGSTSAGGNTIKGLVLGGNANNGVYTALQILNRVENSTTSNGIGIDFDHKTSGATTIPLARIIALPSSSTAGNLRFYTSTSSSLSEAMRIDSSGRVGINTSSPASTLHIGNSTDTSEYITLQSSGDKRLSFKGATATRADIGIFESNHNDFVIRAGASAGIRFVTNNENFSGGGANPIRIDTSGNFGINTNSPTQKLDVNGTVKATAFQGDGSALTNLPGGGKIAQVVTATATAEQRTTSSSYTAVPGVSLNITPSATNSKVYIVVTGMMRVSGGNGLYTIYRGSTNVDGRTGTYEGLLRIDQTSMTSGSLSFLDSPSTTSQITYQVYFKNPNGSYVYLNEHGSNRTVITAFEVLA